MPDVLGGQLLRLLGQNLHQPLPRLVPQGKWAHGVPNLKPVLYEENHRAVRNGVVGSEGADVPASALHLLASLGPLLRKPGPV